MLPLRRSTSDWVSGRLLGPLIKQLLKRGEAGQGEACARALMAWSAAPAHVWLRRASVVGLVTMARLPDSQVFPGFRAALLDTLAVTVRGRERWDQARGPAGAEAGQQVAGGVGSGGSRGAPHVTVPFLCPLPPTLPQTGTGWVLREMGKGDAAQLMSFVEVNYMHFSNEGLRWSISPRPCARAGWRGAGRRRRRQQQQRQPASLAAARRRRLPSGNGAAADGWLCPRALPRWLPMSAWSHLSLT